MIQPSFKTTATDTKDNYARIELEPLEQGYGHTLGNALRRVLLTSLEGAAITQIKIKGVRHQFTTLEGLSEDIIELILGLKQIRLSYSGDEPVTLKLSSKGTKIVTVKDIKTPPTVKIANPKLKLATLSNKAALEAELQVESGTGYSMAEERKTQILGEIPIDALFTPVTKVSYKVESTRVGRRTDYDKLIIDIYTDGTITPQEALNKAAKILVTYFKQIYEPVVVEQPLEATSQFEQPDETMLLTVEELDLPTRIANALRKGGYKTVKDLVEAKPQDIAKVKNLGEKSVKTIASALKKKDVKLQES